MADCSTCAGKVWPACAANPAQLAYCKRPGTDPRAAWLRYYSGRRLYGGPIQTPSDHERVRDTVLECFQRVTAGMLPRFFVTTMRHQTKVGRSTSLD